MYNLLWADSAKESFDENADFLINKWGSEVYSAFYDRVEEVLTTIQQTPTLYPVHRHSPRIHKCVIHKRVVLYYLLKGDDVILLQFWQTSQDVENLSFGINAH